MGWPKLDFEPARTHTQHSTNGDILVVGIEGELAWVDGGTLEQKSKSVTPFPARIILSDTAGNNLVGCWLNRELLISRMASIDLNEEFNEGITQYELRTLADSGSGNAQVKGSKWSHVLDAESLGIDVNDDGIVFALWNRGIYRLNHDASEVWRKPPIDWTSMGTIEDAKIPSTIIKIGKKIHIWSKAGERAILDWETGELLEFNTAQFDVSIDRIFCEKVDSNLELNWLIISDENTAYWITESEDEKSLISAGLRGPVNDAKYDCEIKGWRLIGWREDIIWTNENATYQDTEEIGVSLYNLRGKWMVLNNKGEWVPFGIKNRKKNHSSSEEE